MISTKEGILKNLYKLFEANPNHTSKIFFEKGEIIFRCTDKVFLGTTISKVINFVNTVHSKYKNIKVPLVFDFKDIILDDKLSYILFECICYHLIKEYHHKVVIYMHPNYSINTHGINSSSLIYLNDASGKNTDKYISHFEMEIYHNHFRRIIKGSEKEKTNYLGNLSQAIDTFLKYFSIAEDYRDDVTEVIIELVGNACEHGQTDCLLDIDIADDYSKSVENIPQQGIFYGINIAIVNFSDILLGDGVKDKFETNNLNEDRYIKLKEAYNYHKNVFTKKYSDVDFYNLSSLQDKISGRPYYSLSGGTGLTKLIHSLQEKSDMNACYVISGNRCVRFIRDILDYDDDKWLGFNKERDFFNSMPDMRTLGECYIYFPGTAYNLNFVMKREDENEHN